MKNQVVNSQLHGLYVITDPQLCAARNMPLLDMVAQAIAGGARIVQYRDKESGTGQRLAEAIALAALCREYNVTFLINDDVELAHAVQADGVHLGQGDAPLQIAREKLGPDRIIGVTCHSDIARAQHAQEHGADYVAFGRFFPSHSKPAAPPCSLETLRQARAQLRIPIAAIGGITPDNGAQLIAHGADMLAVIHAVFGAADIRDAASRLAELFNRAPHDT